MDTNQDLNERVKNLEQAVVNLEKLVRQLVLINPDTPSVPVKFVNRVPPTCPACNLDLTHPLGYVCPRSNCPTGLGGIQC